MSFTIYLLETIAFLDLLAIGLIIPLIPAHVRSLGGNHIHVGLLGSVYAGFQLASGPLIGSLSDLKGRKSILITTLLICSLAYTSLGLTTSVIVILTIRAVLGLFKQTQMLTRAMVPDYEPNQKNQGAIYGKMAAISGAGITLGPVIGGHIVEDHPETGFRFIAGIVGMCFALNAGLVYLLPKLPKNKRKRSSKASSSSILQNTMNSLKQSYSELWNIEWSQYWDIFIFKGLVGFAMGVYYSNYALYLKTKFELSPKYIGYIISFQGIVGSLSSFFIGYINSFYIYDDDYSLRNFHIFLLLAVSLTGVILAFNIYIYILLLIPLAIGNAMGRLITLEMVLKRCHGDHRGTLIGASNSVRSLAGVVAPMVAGFIGEFIGVPYVIYASLFSTSLGVILSYQHKYKRLKID